MNRGGDRRRWAERLIWSVSGYYTMGKPIQSPDRAICRVGYSRFCAVTWSSPFSKVLALRSSYNIFIAILSKFLLNPAWIHAQSHNSCTVSLKFRPQTAWQPDFVFDYLQFLCNNQRGCLHQSCSPTIGLQNWCGDLGQIHNNFGSTEP
jgi:hypothetical protein